MSSSTEDWRCICCKQQDCTPNKICTRCKGHGVADGGLMSESGAGCDMCGGTGRIFALEQRLVMLKQLEQLQLQEVELLTRIDELERRTRVKPHAGQGSYCGCKDCVPEERP